MTDPSGPGWRADPSGRFRSRWHDGNTFTDHVLAPDGSVTTAPLSPLAPPSAPSAPPQGPGGGWQQPAQQPTWQQPAPQQPVQQHPQQQWGQPPAQSWQQPPGQQQPPQQPPWQQPAQQAPWQQRPGAPAWAGSPGSGRPRYLPGPGIAVGALGLLCLVLSLFALDWADADNSGFLDIRKPLRHVPSGAHLTFGQHLTVIYAVWAAFVLFGLVVVLVALAGVPLPRSAAGNTYARIAGALLAGLGAVGQVVMITQVFKGSPSPQFGAWLGLIGWFVVAVAFVLGARRSTT